MPDTETTTTTLITRDQWQAYYGVPGSSSTSFELIGEGFTDLSESKNPTEYSRKYIHEKTQRSDVTGYAPQLAYTADVYSGDPVIQDILDITDNEKIGSAAQREIVTVNLWEEQTSQTTTVYTAYKRKYTIIPDAKNGTDALVVSGTMKAAGESIKGTFSLTTKTFTADT